MKLGALTVPLYDRSAEEAFAWLHQRGVQTLELGTGGFPGKTHCDPDVLLADPAKLSAFQDLLKKYQLEVCALSCHSNHVHPNEEVRATAAHDFDATLRLAEAMGIDTVVTFSGCPGAHAGAQAPSWVAVAWPPDYQKTLDYQWNEVVIPFWQQAAKQAAGHGVTKLALEMHPGFCVYNPSSLLRLRSAVGDAIGATFDPSHLFWQGIDPAQAIAEMPGAIHHFHAKDTQIFPRNCAVNGVVDTGSLANIAGRSWAFRSVGYGHGPEVWKNMVTALRMAGYEGALSIEHEDALMSVEEGFEKAIAFLHDVLTYQPALEDVFWA